MKILREICEMGKSVVLVTHNMEDAINADNIIVIKDGVVFTDQEAINQYQPFMKHRGRNENQG
jgi:ABC-type multidrug transport system ATPase subunit